MMPPALLLLGVGKRPVVIPLPLFLVWPLLLLGYLVLGLAWLLSLGRLPRGGILASLLMGLESFRRLRGLSLDVRSKQEKFSLRFV